MASLSYWRERPVALPRYRFRARRETARMIIRWEERVAARGPAIAVVVALMHVL